MGRRRRRRDPRRGRQRDRRLHAVGRLRRRQHASTPASPRRLRRRRHLRDHRRARRVVDAAPGAERGLCLHVARHLHLRADGRLERRRSPPATSATTSRARCPAPSSATRTPTASVPEAGDTGVAGWTVYSDEDNDSVHDVTEPSATTNSLGAYNVTGLANGNYRIRLVAQAGWTCSAPAGCLNTGSIGSGQSDAGMNFGVWGPATISGTVFEDADADGVAKEAGEAGARRAASSTSTRTSTARARAASPFATSDGAGAYAIAGLNPGTYTVRQVLPGGWTCSRPPLLVHDRHRHGHAHRPRLRLVHDRHGDRHGLRGHGRRRRRRRALSGRTVFSDTDGDGALDAGEPQTTSGGGGAYALAGLAPGTHAIRQVLPAGWTQSAPAAAHSVTIVSGATPAGRDFASYTTGSISGTAFEDADFDGSAARGRRPRALRPHRLPRRRRRRPEGRGRAGGDDERQRRLHLHRPRARRLRRPARSCPPTGRARSPAPCSATVTVTSGSSASGRDFGSYVGASVSGTVFEDLDADGAPREAGEPAAAGRRVYLDADADGTRDAGEPTTLDRPDRRLRVLRHHRADVAGAARAARRVVCDSPSPCRHDLALTSGSDHPAQDFGVHAAGYDRRATSSPTATPTAARRSSARTTSPSARSTSTRTTTASRMRASRPSTPTTRATSSSPASQPGTHRVRRCSPPAGPARPPPRASARVVLSSGEAATGNDFSSWTTASFSGIYFEDDDADGEYPEPTESGVAGRTVFLDADDDGVDGRGRAGDDDGRRRAVLVRRARPRRLRRRAPPTRPAGPARTPRRAPRA